MNQTFLLFQVVALSLWTTTMSLSTSWAKPLSMPRDTSGLEADLTMAVEFSPGPQASRRDGSRDRDTGLTPEGKSRPFSNRRIITLSIFAMTKQL